jgi:DNA-binding CsgD family transcriptional regulator/PAS domain-containing protein
MTSESPDIKTFIDVLYDASLDPERLPEFVRSLAAAFGTEFGQFLVRGRDQRGFVINVMSGFDDVEPARFEQDYAFREEQAPWLGAAEDSFSSTAYFRERLRLQGIGDSLWLRSDDGDGHSAMIGLFRRVGAGPFSDCDRDRLQSLRPHLPQAMRLLVRAAETEVENAILRGLCDGMAAASVVTDAAGHVAFANPAAQRLIDSAQGVAMLNGVLTAAVSRQTRDLHDNIRRIARAARDGDLAAVSQTAMSLERPGGGKPVGCVIRPLAARTGTLSGSKPMVHVHLAPAEAVGVPSISLLRGLFGLTPAEGGLLQALMQDKRIEEYAEERGVAVTTVRTQLAHLFRKTDTNRQSELIRLAIMAVGVLAPDEAGRP